MELKEEAFITSNLCCCSVAKLCSNIGHPMELRMPDFPVLYISQSLFNLIFIESVMPFNYLILCCPLLILPSIFPRIRVFSNESALPIRWPKYWRFSFTISPFNEYSGLFPLGLPGLISLQSKGLSRVFSSITFQKCRFFGSHSSLLSNSLTCT